MKFFDHRRPRIRCLLAICACLLYSEIASAQQGQPLRWKFKQGDKFDVTFVQTTEITSQVDQRVKDVDNVLTLAMSWEVTSVEENGNATLDQEISAIKLTMTSLPTGVGKSIDIDTARNEKPKKGVNANLLKQVQPLVGATYTVVMSPRGEIVDVNVPESTLEIWRKVPGSLRLRSLMSETGLKDLFGQSVTVLPQAEPKVDERWQVRDDIDTEIGSFAKQNTYSMTQLRTENGNTLAEFKLETTLEPRATENQPEIKFISYVGNGTLTMNVSDGYFVSSKTSNEMKTEKPYREKAIATTVKTTVEMTIKKN